MNSLDRIVAAVVGSALMLSGPGAALADQAGTPNQNACHGEAVSILATQGFTPAALGRLMGTGAADVNRMIAAVCATGGSAIGAVQKVREAAKLPPSPES